MLFVPTQTSEFTLILEYYVKHISPLKRSFNTEKYRIKPLSDILGSLHFNEITPMHVVAYRDKRLLAPHPQKKGQTLATSTVKLELLLLSHVFNTAITEWGMDTLLNPVQKIRKPKSPPGRDRRLTQQDERKLFLNPCSMPDRT